MVNLNGLSCSLGEKLKKAVSNETTDKIIAEIENTLIEELSLKQDFVDKAQLISDFITISDDISIKSFCDERSINKLLKECFYTIRAILLKFCVV